MVSILSLLFIHKIGNIEIIRRRIIWSTDFITMLATFLPVDNKPVLKLSFKRFEEG